MKKKPTAEDLGRELKALLGTCTDADVTLIGQHLSNLKAAQLSKRPPQAGRHLRFNSLTEAKQKQLSVFLTAVHNYTDSVVGRLKLPQSTGSPKRGICTAGDQRHAERQDNEQLSCWQPAHHQGVSNSLALRLRIAAVKCNLAQ